jgi:predicted DNA-binding transcriptional regulator AlpA
MVDRPKGPIAAWWADQAKRPRDRFLGSRDVARRLGVTRQRVSQLRHDPTFPRAGMHGWGADVWHDAGIECWAAAHRTKRGEAAGRFAGEAGALLLAAEQHAERLNLHWIDSGLFWLAIASGDAGPALQAAMDLMGMQRAEVEAELERWRGTDDRPRRVCRMNPHMQNFLAAADRDVADAGRDRIRPLDILLAFIDAKPQKNHRFRPQPSDHLLAVFQRRGLDIPELRRRLIAADADSASVATFESRRLKPWRRRPRKKPAWLDLAPNPLGHDPWTRHPWGAAFARTRDGRHLKVDGEVWFFTTDGDGFFVRAADGRPVGYRYRLEPKPRLKPTNGFTEILPMPPVEIADWPDRRYGPEV